MVLVKRMFRVRADPATTWSHLADVTAWPRWAHHIRRVTLDPPGELTASTRGRLLLEPAIPTTFRVTALDPPNSWSWRGSFLGTTLDYDHRVERADDGTQITFTIAGTGATARVVGPLFARVYGRILDRAIPNLVAELDAR
jgi:hypothetical protein